MRAWDFFVKSQQDRPARLQTYQPRREEPEELVAYHGGGAMGVLALGTYSMGLMVYDSAQPMTILYRQDNDALGWRRVR